MRRSLKLILFWISRMTSGVKESKTVWETKIHFPLCVVGLNRQNPLEMVEIPVHLSQFGMDSATRRGDGRSMTTALQRPLTMVLVHVGDNVTHVARGGQLGLRLVGLDSAWAVLSGLGRDRGHLNYRSRFVCLSCVRSPLFSRSIKLRRKGQSYGRSGQH